MIFRKHAAVTCFLFLLAFVIVKFKVISSSAAASALGNLAASMQPGTWAQLAQTNINNILGQGLSEGNQIPYGFSAAWDPVRERLHLTGSDHRDTVSATKYHYYDAASNSWTLDGSINGFTWGHGYDHNTIDPVTGIFYVREKGLDTTGNAIWSRPPGGSWSVRTRWPVGGYIQVAIGTDWWTGSLSGGGSQGSYVVYNCGSAEIRIWNPQTDQWLTALNSFNGSSTYHCFIEYSSVYNVAVFGGGNLDRRKIWRLNADRTVTALPDSPIDLGIQAANVVPDPNTGNFLVMGMGQFWELDPRGGSSWRQLPAPPAAVGNPGSPSYDSVISASLSNYGVVTYVTCRTSNCNMYLYRHAAGSGTPPPPPPPVDTTAPNVSITNPTAGSTVSSTVTISATASDNVGVAGVQFKVDGQNLGSEDIASPHSISWNTSAVSNGSHVLTAVARDAAGNQTTSSAVSVSVNNVASNPPPSSDFTTRCAAAGVLKCVGFDQASDIAGTYGDNSGILPGDAIPQLDSGIKASGNSALKFTIPSNSGANSSGSYFTNFSNDLSVQFGENSEFYVQWRQRFSPEFLSTFYQGAGGWKQSILGTGDKLGCTSSTSANGLCSGSCSTLETVTQNTFQRGFAQMYNSCTGSTSHGPYNPFEQPFGTYDFKLQNARPTPYCLYSQSQTTPTSFLPPLGNCFGYFPNEWMTFQVRIKTGPRVNDEFTNSYIELWIGREGQASLQALNWGPYNLSAGSPTEDQRFGKVWLLPYDTGKSSAQTHPVGYTWYDELIISRNRIADPGGSTPPPPGGDTTPPVITSVVVSNITSNSATIAWTTDEQSDSQIQYGTTTAYGSATSLNSSLVTAHVQNLSGLAGSTTYNFRVRSADGSGNQSLSSNFTFATAAGSSPSGGVLEGYWKFDESGGALASDSSGNGLTGILTNGPTFTTGKYGNAIRLDGTNDYVDLGNPVSGTLNITGSMTLSAWVNASAFPSDDAAVVSRRQTAGYQLDLTRDTGPRTIGFKLDRGSGGQMIRYGATTLAANTWYHIAGVYDATSRTVHVYLNGVLDDGSLVGTVDGSQLSTPLQTTTIGRRAGSVGYEFNGMIDDVRIYSRALSQAEVQASSGPSGPDATPPLISITTPVNGNSVGGSAVIVSAAASDNVGVVGVQFKLDGANFGAEDTIAPFAVTWNSMTASDGSHTLTAVARDAANNQTTAATITVIVDNTAPTISLTAPANGATVSGSVAVSANASDNSAVIGVQFKLDGANLGSEDTTAPYSVNWNASASANGSHTLTAIARDAAGNQTTSFPVMVTVTQGSSDTVVPTVSITSPASGGTVSGSGVTVSATASDNIGVVGVQFALDGVSLGAEVLYEPYSVVWNTSAVSNGMHILTATARDAAGNQSISSPVFVIVSNTGSDSISPTVSIAAPQAGSTVSGLINLSATASDNIAVVGVQFKLDGVSLGPEDVTEPYSVVWDATLSLNGIHVLTAFARDAAGNIGVSAPISVNVNNNLSYNLSQNSGQIFNSYSIDNTLLVGSVRVEPSAGSNSPTGVAIVGYTVGDVLVTEAGVPSSPEISSGRFYFDVNGPVNTGIAFANSSDQEATIFYYFTDFNGRDYGQGFFKLAAQNQVSKFLDQPPFNLRPPAQGAFTFTSSGPVSVIVLRGFTNERGEFLFSTIPVTEVEGAGQNSTAADVVSAAESDSGSNLVLPHFADGGGWTTQLMLTNPTAAPISGTVQFLGSGSSSQGAVPADVQLNGIPGSSFSYQLPAGGAMRLATANTAAITQVGSIRITPASNNASPSAVAVFNYKKGDTTVTEASISALPTRSASQMFVEFSGGMNEVGSVQTGIAIANPAQAPVNVTLELRRLEDGSIAAAPSSIVVPASGQLSRFLGELFPNLPTPFRGTLRVISSSPVAVAGLRGRLNQRGDFLISTVPPVPDAMSSSARLIFPHVVSGGGYNTQLILFGTTPTSAAGRIFFVSREGVTQASGNLRQAQ